MRSSRHSIPSPPNAFSPSFLQRIGELDEPPVAGEADVAGPWHIEEMPAGFGLFRLGESLDRGFPAYAVFRDRWLALLAAAVLPGSGRDYAFLLDKEADAEGFAIVDTWLLSWLRYHLLADRGAQVAGIVTGTTPVSARVTVQHK